ncbi:pseudouridine synthase [Chloroflexota bacterium]
MTQEPLIKVLTGAGVGSRRKVADLIRGEKVKVNSEIVTGFNHPINAGKDKVTVSGQPVLLQREETVYLMLHKPKGVLSTASDEQGRWTVMHLLPARYRKFRLYPVGRLDKASTGLLLLTNDGDLTYQLTHPKFEQEKEYHVQIEGELSSADRRGLVTGIKLEEGVTAPAKIREVAGAAEAPFNYVITIHEGKKRQVRRMFVALGHRVLALKRVRFGKLTLGDLEEGRVRELKAFESRLLRGKS